MLIKQGTCDDLPPRIPRCITLNQRHFSSFYSPSSLFICFRPSLSIISTFDLLYATYSIPKRQQTYSEIRKKRKRHGRQFLGNPTKTEGDGKMTRTLMQMESSFKMAGFFNSFRKRLSQSGKEVHVHISMELYHDQEINIVTKRYSPSPSFCHHGPR